jgi:hypothetical protein
MQDGTVHRGDPADLDPIQFFRNRKLAEESFMELTEGLIPAGKRKRIVEAVFHLEEMKDISDLTRLFWLLKAPARSLVATACACSRESCSVNRKLR